MIQLLEKLLLELLRWFFSQTSVVGLLVLGALGMSLVAMQFFRKSQTALPGIFGIIFIALAYAHFADSHRIAHIFDQWLYALDFHSTAMRPLPFGLETIYRIFVGVPEQRLLHQEILFTLLAVYFGSFA